MSTNSGGPTAAATTTTKPSAAKFRAIGFCGADDSVRPNLLAIVGRSYPLVEWGVLFRPDKESTPRYAGPSWIEELGAVAKTVAQTGTPMKLAAHLCGSRVNDLLGDSPGDDAARDRSDAFLSNLERLGFRRVQVNATAVNGVDTSALKESAPIFLQVAERFPNLEFILQKNDETEPLWSGVLDLCDGSVLPRNVTMLLDESKGTGASRLSSSSSSSDWPPPPPAEYEIGYAGGIGPDNVRDVLRQVSDAAPGRSVWIDMESSLRSTKNGQDVFDLDKCYRVIEAACEHGGIMQHPDFLPPSL